MTYAPTNPLDVPPYQLQPLISSIGARQGPSERRASHTSTPAVQVRCAQALGSEIYVGCSNGELLRFGLQADNPTTLESYRLQSRQTLPNERPIDEIVLVPSISRALILSDHQIHFYTVPSLDPVPLNIIKPIRNVITFAVDYQHIRRPPPSVSGPPHAVETIDFCVIKRGHIAMYTLRERLFFQKEISLPQSGTLARRTGRYLCVADKENYNVVDLENASLFPILPLSQAPGPGPAPFLKPFIVVVGESEFLILSWTGASTLGVFITGEGDPVRGTLEWPSHPEDVCLDYPYITTLLPNNTIEIHNVETQTIVQVISAPPPSSTMPPSQSNEMSERLRLANCLNGYLVPSTQRSDKMRTTPVRLLRAHRGPQVGATTEELSSPVDVVQGYDI